MSVELNGFDADQVEPSQFDVLPEGEYVVVITESEQKANKAGTGFYIKTTFQVLDGEHKGRLLWGQYNLSHQNADAVKIAKRELADICLAVNVPRPKSTGELHNLPLKIKVKVEERKDSPGEYQNRIKKYMSASGVSHVAAPASTASAPANAAPWGPKKAGA